MPEQAKQVADAAVEGRFASAHRALVGDGSIQFDLPVFEIPKPPAWLEPVARFFKWLAPAYPYLFWGAIALAGLAIGYLVVSNIDGFEWPWRKRRATEAVEDNWRPDASAARALLTEAEALAAQGRYAEAARLLLQRSVEDIARRLPEFLKPSLTARDISGAEALPGAARPAFTAIARVVEVSAFGSRAVTADAWEQCRAAYARFALPESWQRG